MSKRKKRKPMPKWVWYLPPKYLNYKLKHLLAYIWWYGDKGCREWNYRIAKRFKVSSRTIRRWIKKLDDEHFIYINFPMKRSRTIYRRPYYSMVVWLRKSGRVADLPQTSQKNSQPTPSRTEVSYISNAQRNNTYQQGIIACRTIRKAVEKPDGRVSNLSNAEGLSCSGNSTERLSDIIKRLRLTGTTVTQALNGDTPLLDPPPSKKPEKPAK